ncbi:MAG: MFS transporter [Candidatus Saccharimonadia bacterium]
MSEISKKKNGHRNILSVGFASFFGGISQDIFIPILPLYLTQILGFDRAMVGIAEGLVSAASSVFKIIAGRLSDKYKKQKPIVIAGYALSMVGRGILAFVSVPLAVFGLRFADGVGKGIKDPPKDVLVANAADKATRGRSFGIARMLDTFGSALGPLILSGLIVIFTRHNIAPSHYYRWLMILSASVLLITIAIVKFGVKETRDLKTETFNAKATLAKSFYLFTAIAGIFAIANSSDAFLILRSQNLGLSIVAIPLAYAVLNIVYGSLSLHAGIISDKIGRIPIITLGWAVYALSYFGFAVAHSAWQVWPLFALYGVFYAANEGVGRALIADVVGQEARGRAYGLYNMIIGLAALPASLIAGLLWDHIGPSAPFFFSTVVSLVAVILLLGFRKQLRPALQHV